jgi:hypothetical protein
VQRHENTFAVLTKRPRQELPSRCAGKKPWRNWIQSLLHAGCCTVTPSRACSWPSADLVALCRVDVLAVGDRPWFRRRNRTSDSRSSEPR